MTNTSESLFRELYIIRAVEREIERLFSLGKMRGTTHGCIGQEAVAVGVCRHLDADVDYATGNHRSHGHYLALGGSPESLLAELMGKATGAIRGKGGSQHLCFKNFFSNGITGGMLPVAAGLAYSLKISRSPGIAVAFVGDGAMNEGYLMEAMNLAAVKKLPLLVVLENNGYAMSTSVQQATAGSFAARAAGFGLGYLHVRADDAEKTLEVAGQAVKAVRKQGAPLLLECETFRFSGHSKSDKREYIPAAQETWWRENDAVERCARRLGATAEIIRHEVDALVAEASQRALTAPFPEPQELYPEEKL